MHPEELEHDFARVQGRLLETLLKLTKRSKGMSYSMSTLFEAMHALAIFHPDPDVDPEQDVHVTMEGTQCGYLLVTVSRAY